MCSRLYPLRFEYRLLHRVGRGDDDVGIKRSARVTQRFTTHVESLSNPPGEIFPMRRSRTKNSYGLNRAYCKNGFRYAPRLSSGTEDAPRSGVSLFLIIFFPRRRRPRAPQL